MDSVSTLRLAYSRYNTIYFHGKLPLVSNILIEVIEDQDPEELGYDGCTYMNKRRGKTVKDASLAIDGDYWYVIKIINFNKEKSEDELLDILAHEMIHIWQMDVLDFYKFTEPMTWRMSHNKTFVAKMNQINLMSKSYGEPRNITVVAYEHKYKKKKAE